MLNDRNRIRKTYSFYRPLPVPFPSTSGDEDLLIVASAGQLSAENTSELESGQMAFVQSFRDYFFLEKTVNTGSTNSTDRIAGTGGGVWHRLSLGGNYWKNQLTWYINSESGNDENLGSSDKPLQTLDELTRRLFHTEVLRSAYTVNITSVTQSVSTTYGLDIKLGSGSVTFLGAPAFSASVGMITQISGAVNYTSQQGPLLRFTLATGSVSSDLLYASSSAGGFLPLGWTLSGEAGVAHMTPFITGAVSQSLFVSMTPKIMTPFVNVSGDGSVIFNKTRVHNDSGLLTLSGDSNSSLHFVYSSLSAQTVDLNRAFVVLDASRIYATNGNITIRHGSFLSSTGSGLVTTRKIVSISDSAVEVGGIPVWDSTVGISSARVILSVGGASGSALLSSSLSIGSNSIVDVKDLIASNTSGITFPVAITGQDVTVFYNTSQTPKADTLLVNNGITPAFTGTWAASLPYSDLLSKTYIVSGALSSVIA